MSNNNAACAAKLLVRGAGFYGISTNLVVREGTTFRNNLAVGDTAAGGAVFLAGLGNAVLSVSFTDAVFSANEARSNNTNPSSRLCMCCTCCPLLMCMCCTCCSLFMWMCCTCCPLVMCMCSVPFSCWLQVRAHP
jgi:hypothetical protein